MPDKPPHFRIGLFTLFRSETTVFGTVVPFRNNRKVDVRSTATHSVKFGRKPGQPE
jgi:hypothetical protein